MQMLKEGVSACRLEYMEALDFEVPPRNYRSRVLGGMLPAPVTPSNSSLFYGWHTTHRLGFGNGLEDHGRPVDAD